MIARVEHIVGEIIRKQFQKYTEQLEELFGQLDALEGSMDIEEFREIVASVILNYEFNPKASFNTSLCN